MVRSAEKSASRRLIALRYTCPERLTHLVHFIAMFSSLLQDSISISRGASLDLTLMSGSIIMQYLSGKENLSGRFVRVTEESA